MVQSFLEYFTCLCGGFTDYDSDGEQELIAHDAQVSSARTLSIDQDGDGDLIFVPGASAGTVDFDGDGEFEYFLQDAALTITLTTTFAMAPTRIILVSCMQFMSRCTCMSSLHYASASQIPWSVPSKYISF